MLIIKKCVCLSRVFHTGLRLTPCFDLHRIGKFAASVRRGANVSSLGTFLHSLFHTYLFFLST
jgi:hypothetical protein